MKLSEFIEKLNKMIEENPKINDADVCVEYSDNDGCDTCGHGASEILREVCENKIYDLDNKIVISVYGEYD
jgi:hypothetical protein